MSVETFMQAASKRIRAQALQAEQLFVDAEEAKLMAVQRARQNDRQGVAIQLKRHRQLLQAYGIELEQRHVLEEALATVRRAITNASLAQQLGQANMVLTQLLAQSGPDVEEAMDTLRDYHQRVSMDSAELARPLTVAAEPVEDSEIDSFMATSLQLPSVTTTSRAPRQMLNE